MDAEAETFADCLGLELIWADAVDSRRNWIINPRTRKTV